MPFDKDVADTLLYSDDPESLSLKDGPAEGILFDAQISGGRKRLLFYHVNLDSVARCIGVRIVNIGTQPVSLRTLQCSAPADKKYLRAGHLCAAAFVRALIAGSWTKVDLAQGKDAVLSKVTISNNELAVGFVELDNPTGSSLKISVISASGDDRISTVGAAGMQIKGDGHGRTGVYPLIPQDIASLDFAVGSPSQIPVPTKVFPNLRRAPDLPSDKRAPNATYGAFTKVNGKLSNPSGHDEVAYLYVTAAGGNSTATFLIDGQLVETGVLQCGTRPPRPRYKLQKYLVSAGTSRDTEIVTTTDPSASAPLDLIFDRDDGSPDPGRGIVFVPGQAWNM